MRGVDSEGGELPNTSRRVLRLLHLRENLVLKIRQKAYLPLPTNVWIQYIASP